MVSQRMQRWRNRRSKAGFALSGSPICVYNACMASLRNPLLGISSGSSSNWDEYIFQQNHIIISFTAPKYPSVPLYRCLLQSHLPFWWPYWKDLVQHPITCLIYMVHLWSSGGTCASLPRKIWGVQANPKATSSQSALAHQARHQCSESSICSQLVLLKPSFQGLKGETDTTILHPRKEGREKAHNTTLRNTSSKFFLLNVQHLKPLYPLAFEISIPKFCHSSNNSSFHLCKFYVGFW